MKPCNYDLFLKINIVESVRIYNTCQPGTALFRQVSFHHPEQPDIELRRQPILISDSSLMPGLIRDLYFPERDNLTDLSASNGHLPERLIHQKLPVVFHRIISSC